MTGALAAHLWQSTLFAVIAGLLTLAFRKNRAQIRYWLWLTASVKFLVPFALLMSLGSHLGWAPAAQKIATPSVTLVVERITQPFSAALSFVATTPAATHWVPIAILGVWGCGFAAIALLRLRFWLRIRAAVRAGTCLEIPAGVEVRSSPGLLEPGVVGLLRPILLLPEGIMERLTPAQLETVLAHELCHVRRRDNLFASIHMLVEAVFWFHPLVWWIGARLVEERERACDEGVLGLGSEPRIYADAILNVCKLYVESPLVCVAGVTGAGIKRRIEAIMRNRVGQRLNHAKKLLLATAGFAALAGPVAIGVVIGAGNAPVVRAQRAQILYTDRRLVAMLFDFGGMIGDEQFRARESAIDFVRNRMEPSDSVAVMTVNNGRVTVVQDFANDRTVLEAAIQKLGAADGNSFVPGGGARLSTIQTASILLSAIPGKKMLMYFSIGLQSSGANDPSELRNAIETLQKSNVAIYAIDVRRAFPATPPGPQSAPPRATFPGTPDGDSTLAEALGRESQDRSVPRASNTFPGFPGRHASFQIYRGGESQVLSVPLDLLSGRVDIIGQIKTLPDTGAPGQNVANLRDNVQASAGTYQASFVLGAGTYICAVLIREQTTGRMYSETIHFEVK